MMFDMEYLSKSKAPSSPKPSGTAKRPVLGRKRDTVKTSKVVNLEEFCARVVVDDLIQGALKDDARNAAEDLFFDEDEFPELVEKYDDYDEDDVVSLAGQSDSDEEELENFNLVCQVTKRAVKGALQDDFHGIDFGKAVEDASRDASTEDSTDGFCEVVDLSDEEVDSEGDGVPQTDIAPETAPVKESVATSPPKFHMLPSVGTWMVPSFRAPVTPVPVAPPAPSVESSSAMRKSSSVTKMKRRIIGATVPAVARAPAESLPVDPAPPSGSRAGINWFLAGSVANGLRSQKEVMTFNMAEDDQVEEKRPGLARKSSITAMFEAMGSAELIRMDHDEEPLEPLGSALPSSKGLRAKGSQSRGTASASAMALDLGLDLGMKERRPGSSAMGSRCSSMGSLRKEKFNLHSLPSLQKGGAMMDWSVSNSISFKPTHSWALNGRA